MPAGIRRAIPAFVTALALAVPAGGCDGDEEGAATPGSPAEPGAGGALEWALAERPEDLDPVRADTRPEQLVTRQVHEPLVTSLTGPFGDQRRVPGLALSARGTAGDTVWSFRLRPGVRFQDGTPFNAAAVVANGRRWLTTSGGQALMPELFAVDTPRPGLVRFLLERANPSFPDVLASPQAGIVSPRALFPRSGEGAILRRDSRSGTGPFELRESDRSGSLVARNVDWWGSERELGPALDQAQFRVVPEASERLALLEGGDVQLAEALGPEEAGAARRAPLLDVLEGEVGALGLERSVRGVESGREVPSLSGVWLTRINNSAIP